MRNPDKSKIAEAIPAPIAYQNIYKILMRADKGRMQAGTIHEVGEREARDLEALGYARILEVRTVEVPAPQQTRKSITLANQPVETAAMDGGEQR